MNLSYLIFYCQSLLKGFDNKILTKLELFYFIDRTFVYLLNNPNRYRLYSSLEESFEIEKISKEFYPEEELKVQLYKVSRYRNDLLWNYYPRRSI